MIAHYHAPYRAPLFASLLLILTLLQASNFTLSLAFRGPFASDTVVTLITLVWLAMYAFASIGLFASFGMNWVTWLVRYRLLLTFVLAGAAFSVAWSVDTALSAERTVHLIGTSVVALYLGFSLPLNRILRISVIVLGFIMATSVIAATLIPELGLEDYQGKMVWAGTLASKNSLGFWAAITFLLGISLSFWTVPISHRLLYIAIAAISLLCLYNSVSATSLLALITATLVMIYLHVAFSLRLSLFAMLLLGVLVAGLVGVAFHFIDTAELIGRSGDLTGRGEVWAQTWKLILERPLTGYGYGTLWYPTEESLWIQQSLTDFTWTVFHAHNGLLQVASEIGLPLTALIVLMIMQQLVEITYCQYRRQQAGLLFVLGFFVTLLVSNYSEARLLINRDLSWIFFIALPVSMLQQVSAMARRPAYNATTGHAGTNGPYKLRDARQRKEQKKNVKERLKHVSGLRVINPNDNNTSTDTDSVDNRIKSAPTVAGASIKPVADTPTVVSKSNSTPLVTTKSKRVANKNKARTLKANLRSNKTS